MNRYTTEDFEELGNIAEEICCEKKFNPFMFKKTSKQNKNSDEEDKPKSSKKKSTKKINEDCLVEFEENHGIPWEPINEAYPSDYFDHPEDFEQKTSDDSDDFFDDKPNVDDGDTELGEVPNIVDSEEDESDSDSIENDPGYGDTIEGSSVRSDADTETEDDYGYDPDEEMKPVRSVSRKEPPQDISGVNGDDAGVAVDDDSSTGKITLEFDDGEVIDFDSNQFPTEDIIKNLTTDKIGDGEDDDFVARIVSIDGVPADEWARLHGVTDIKPGRSPEDMSTDNSEELDHTKDIGVNGNEGSVTASDRDELANDLDVDTF